MNKEQSETLVRITNELAALLNEQRIRLDALEQQRDELVEVVKEVTATLSWIEFGECRVAHEKQIMPPAMAVERALTVIAKHNATKEAA